jgi:flagellar hook-length control protein FliK
VQLAIQPLLNNGQGGAVRMTLNPPELGKLEVHLKIENGQVYGTIAAQESGVVEHLARELPALRQSLVDAGLKLGDQGLSLMLSNQQQPDQQTPQNPFAALPDDRGRRQSTPDEQGFGTISAEPLATGVMPGRWVAPTQLVDVAA